LVDLTSVSEDIPQQDMTILDLVVTILLKFNSQALDAFLDLDRSEVHFLSRRNMSSDLDFCIKRKDRTIKVDLIQS